MLAHQTGSDREDGLGAVTPHHLEVVGLVLGLPSQQRLLHGGQGGVGKMWEQPPRGHAGKDIQWVPRQIRAGIVARGYGPVQILDKDGDRGILEKIAVLLLGGQRLFVEPRVLNGDPHPVSYTHLTLPTIYSV